MLPESHQRIGFFASVALILNYLYRPSANLAERIEQEKRAIGWPSEGTPVLGIHYRAGDSCIEDSYVYGRQCDSFDLYMAEAELLQQKYGFTHIFVATDSDSLISELEGDYPNWTFLYMKNIDRGGARNKETIDRLLYEGRLDGCTEATQSFMDIYLLGQCDSFIGKFSSNIDRVAYAFMFARARQHVPHISLDTNWCFDYGVRLIREGPRSWNPILNLMYEKRYYC